MKPKITAFDDNHGRYLWTVEYDGIPGIDPADRKRARAKVYRDFVAKTDDYGVRL